MESSHNNKYIKGFSNELLKFISFIEKLIPTNSTQKILDKYQQINMNKLIRRYYNVVHPFKERLTKRDISIFSNALFIIPEFNISFFWNNLPEENREYVWTTLSRLLIYSTLVIDNSNNTVSLQSEKKNIKQSPIPVNNSTTVPPSEVNPYVGIGNNNADISVASLQNEIRTGAIECNPMLKMLKNTISTDGFASQLKNLDENVILQMTDEVKKLITQHIDDPQVSGTIEDMLSNIGDELKSNDLSNGDLFEKMIKIAEKMSTKMLKDAADNKFSSEKLLASTQAIMKGIGMPENMSIEDLLSGGDTNMLSLLMSSLKK